MTFAVGLCAAITVSLYTSALPAETIVLVSHGETASRGFGQLSCRGLNRSIALALVLPAKYGHPNEIFAPDAAERNSDVSGLESYVVPLTTIEPTAISLGMPVSTPVGFADRKGIQKAILAPYLAHSLVFVAWEHLVLVDLARSIMKANNGDPSLVPDWPESDYDSIYVITIDNSSSRPTASFTHDREGLDNQRTSCP